MTSPSLLERAHFQHLLDALLASGYRVVGPSVRDAAIIYDEIGRVDDLPVGWTDEQAPGHYRLKRRSDQALFGYVVGPHSWKKYLHPPAERLWRMQRDGKAFSVCIEPSAPLKYAFIGARACELHAIGIFDQVMTGGATADPSYAARRAQAFVVAVNCIQAGGTCFCVSMQTGPRAVSGFDLALTELISESEHVFVVETGSERGAEVLQQVPHRPASEREIALARGKVKAAAAQMGRSLETAGLKELLYRNYEHPRWDEVAQRCLTCANCTMVCPTCFCTTVEDVTEISGEHAERWRKWDSCFTLDYSHIHGGSVRASGRSRYRHWMVHKLATWFDQFGRSGCVGCGRCIAWCPAGIDITEEARAIRTSEQLRGEEHDETA